MAAKSSRLAHLRRFYKLMDAIDAKIGGAKTLAACSGRLSWPRRGVYFFMEAGEVRSDTGSGPRIVRIGTHALSEGSASKLWGRLAQHKGVDRTGAGNHRGSIFRLIVGTALIKRHGYKSDSWGDGSTAETEVRKNEIKIETEVSRIIRAMPFIWLAIDDEAGPDSLRGYIERNAIALLSNFRKDALDAPSPRWLGRHCKRERVRKSGLWNQNHVDENYAPDFLDRLEEMVADMDGRP